MDKGEINLDDLLISCVSVTKYPKIRASGIIFTLHLSQIFIKDFENGGCDRLGLREL
jgi:hypothetical protein